MKSTDVLSIILGGGQGTRLFPLTANRSKPAVPIAGKYRLVDIPISNCFSCDLKRIYVLTQFNSASLNKHIKNTYNFSFFTNAFVDVLAAEQTMKSKEWFQGTADAIRQCMTHFLQHEWKYALILSGDQLYQMDFNEMLDQHIKSGAEITVATQPVTAKEGTAFGILKTGEGSFITSFTEKPNAEEILNWNSEVSEDMKKDGREYLASMGIYIFNRDLLIELMNDETTLDFGKEIIPQSIGKHKVLGYQYEGYWTDIGTIASFFEANIDLTKDLPKFNLYDNDNRIYTRPRILPTSKFTGSTIDHAVIADGCIIHADEIRNSVIGVRSRIGKGSRVINTYMMGANSYESLKEVDQKKIENLVGVGENCHIERCILEKNCRIGDGTTIIGSSNLKDHDAEFYTVVDGIVVVKSGAEIPKGFELK